AAIAMHADHLQVAAHIAPAREACVASPAADHGIHGDKLTHARAVHAFADRVDAPDALVADPPRIHDARMLAVQDVHVRTADAGEAHPHANFGGGRLRLRPLAHGHPIRLLD